MWGLKVVDMRTAIVFGVSTNETNLHSDLNTRFDFDFNFGVVINRFCAMSAIDYDLTVYGKGLQKRPFISLKDFVKSIVNLINYKQKRSFEVFNQTSQLLTIKYLAETIVKNAKKIGSKSNLKMIKNPRVEKEKHNMKMENKLFLNMLKSEPVLFKDESIDIIKTLLRYKNKLTKYKKSFI